MALRRQVLFPYLTMIIISIISGSASSLHGDSPHDYDRLEEYGYDFDAYPSSYMSYDIEEDNDQGVGRVLASATTVSVDHYGAKGDGSSDDTQVPFYIFFFFFFVWTKLRNKKRDKKTVLREL
ncbi:hypothetical protein RHGRI_006356 [Rhododendron griersonianum]|uniref:Glycine-rich protein n=1 Tax=Rhododendron griersonianum TaxID=479676 RepID=A0AAV6KTD5_9ERIC|nr:hypothetical protein RHGRI_006356 [Rhododendron griersonianum]